MDVSAELGDWEQIDIDLLAKRVLERALAMGAERVALAALEAEHAELWARNVELEGAHAALTDALAQVLHRGT